ncbi:integrase [Frankia sp. AgB1.9]|uniref:hypothetical protein n=1 Tax=unclassified Frankia TaxID=2632575 RepID=UPI0019340EF1|nr:MULTISPECIES: hypothetical protein [unclassified Frankia]MBL7494331.1 integrase [Frankia sp. AgW1.1]MBL7553576.1 integrase [Frankia sp. AgB1.9]MBL7622231.1 hypothetical protein [Frankia sp. AgB1.8]
MHVAEVGCASDGRLFAGMRGGDLSDSVVGRTWAAARTAALTPAQAAGPLARRVYDLRHACLSGWLNAGVSPQQVAEWAGHSVAVLLHTYAKCVDGDDLAARRRDRGHVGAGAGSMIARAHGVRRTRAVIRRDWPRARKRPR